jgi:hypothetical protein
MQYITDGLSTFSGFRVGLVVPNVHAGFSCQFLERIGKFDPVAVHNVCEDVPTLPTAKTLEVAAVRENME